MMCLSSFAKILFLATCLTICGQSFNEDECLQSITTDNAVMLPEQATTAMSQGFWNCSKIAIESLGKISSQAKMTEFKTIFDSQYRAIMKELAALKTQVDSFLSSPLVSPAFQWAQSPSEIFLNVKFSHKLDAPATLNVEPTNVTMTPEGLYLEASDGRKIFKLVLDFFGLIMPDESKYEMSSVGRMTFTLKKADNSSKWKRLLSAKKSNPQNMHLWLEVQERYKTDLKKMNPAKKHNTKKKTEIPPVPPKPDEDDEEDRVKVSSNDGPPNPLQGEIDKINKQKFDLLSKWEEDSKKKKQELDVEWRENKRKIDAEFNAKKKELEAKVKEDLELLKLAEIPNFNDRDSL